VSSGAPSAFDEDDSISQNVGQPCFKRTGGLPLDAATPCTKAQQEQPAFDGKQSVYNSGVIRYEGVRGNTFKVKLADDIKPGTYYFYCAVHGFGQITELNVKAKNAKVESAAEVARRGRAEAEKALKPLAKIYRQVVRTGKVTLGDDKLSAPFAGLYAEGADHTLVNEFLPRRITAKVNEPITWTMLGSDHTISFDVPKYFPIVEFDTPKGVRMNPRLKRAAGGAAEPPEQEGMGVFEVDGGTYDGTGFWSSGLIGADPYAKYTLRISKPGTYAYACLIHPPMIGQVVVT
jgi:plastocyanin